MELIKITEQNGQQAVSARELHRFLIQDAKGGQEGRMFAHWINEKLNYLDAKEGKDYQTLEFDYMGNLLAKNGKTDNQDVKVHKRDYVLTLDIAKEIAMIQNNDKGKQARIYFIECERKLKEVYQIPKTYAEALMLAAKQAEKIEKQEKQILKENEEKQIALQVIEMQDEEIEESKPKVEFYDTVAESKDLIDMGTVSKLLNIKGYGRNNLIRFLRVKGVLMQDNQPYQRYMSMGYFKTIEQPYNLPNGNTQVNIKTLVYQKGLDFIRKLVSYKN